MDEVAARLIDLELTGRSSLGDVRISLDPLQLSSGVVEETVNNTDGVLDVAPWAGGTAMATFNAVVRIEIGDDIYRMPAPMTLSATISHTTAAVGEGFQFSTRTELVDESGQPSSLFLVSAGLTPSPEHPWQNPVSRFDVDNNGPSHTVVEGLYMGGGVDAEAAVTPSLTASHNKNDKHRVEALARELSDKHGLRVWFDVWEMLPGTIEQQCEQGIRQSRFTVVAASRAALNSE